MICLRSYKQQVAYLPLLAFPPWPSALWASKALRLTTVPIHLFAEDPDTLPSSQENTMGASHSLPQGQVLS